MEYFRSGHDKASQEVIGSWLYENDIIAYVETWVKDSVMEIEGYTGLHFIRNNINPRAKRGSGGISIFIKDYLKNAVSVIKHYKYCLVWLKITQNDEIDPILIGIVYFPPEGSVYNCMNDDYFQILETDRIQFCEEYNVFICGDINARTGQLGDVPKEVEGSEGQADKHNVLTEYFPAALCEERRTQHEVNCNSYGKKLIDLCKSANMRILNGRTKGDSEGKLTRIETTGNSVVDYGICHHKGVSVLEDLTTVP